MLHYYFAFKKNALFLIKYLKFTTTTLYALICKQETELDCEMNVTDEDIGGAHGEDMGGAHGEDRDAWFLRYFENLF